MTQVQSAARDADLVTMTLGETHFGIPVLQVRDVLDSPATYAVPLAPPEIAGSINLRGRIVTAIDLRARLGMALRDANAAYKCIIVESETTGEPYAFLVDDVGDVLSLSAAHFEATPVTVSSAWAAICRGLYRQDNALLLVLDPQSILAIQTEQTESRLS